jgi:hypothetical protein
MLHGDPGSMFLAQPDSQVSIARLPKFNSKGNGALPPLDSSIDAASQSAGSFADRDLGARSPFGARLLRDRKNWLGMSVRF